MSTSTIASPSARDQRLNVPDESAALATENAWKLLYRIGAVAALTSVAFIAIAAIVLTFSQPPTTVTGWFALYHENWLLGLLAADLLMLASYILIGLITFALYGALRRVNQPFMALATIFTFVGMAAYFASNPAFAMLSLSNQYDAATTDAERTALLGAGQALIANWTGTAFDVAYFLGGVTVIIIAVIMLQSSVFSKATAYTGLLLGVLTLVPASAGMLGVVFSLVALIPTVVWYILLAWRFFQLGNAPVGGTSKP